MSAPSERWIVSASRRTDIPAFYPEWLEARVAAGWAVSVNPFNRRGRRVSLRSADVRALVLWSKDYSRFLPVAERLANVGHHLYFQYTINDAPEFLEPGVPRPEVTVPAAHALARRFGAGAVQWRYDPILRGGGLDARWHTERFTQLARQLRGATHRCIVSFGTYYRKVDRNLRAAGGAAAELAPWVPSAVRELARELAAVASEEGMTLSACCAPEARSAHVTGAACVDAAHLEALYPGAGAGVRAAASREGCGCSASRDIGLYDSCRHGCVYCYACRQPGAAPSALPDPRSPVLFGRLETDETGGYRWRP